MPSTDAPLSLPESTEITPPLPGQSAVDLGLVAETLAEVNAAYERGALTTGRSLAAIVLDKMFRDDVRRFLAEAEDHESYVSETPAGPQAGVGHGGI